MRVGLLGRKVGMTQIYQPDSGDVIPVTVIECGPCTVLQVKTQEQDRYDALQLGYMDKRRKSATKPESGRAKAAGCEPKRFIREVRQDGPTEHKLGDVLTVNVFEGVPRVDVIGTSKGRGFSGVIKRHGFKGLRASHGVKRMHRHPGSSGPSADPARTRKGIRKPGQYGNARITAMNLQVVRIDAENNLLLVRGAIPGANGGFVTIRQTTRKK